MVLVVGQLFINAVSNYAEAGSVNAPVLIASYLTLVTVGGGMIVVGAYYRSKQGKHKWED